MASSRGSRRSRTSSPLNAACDSAVGENQILPSSGTEKYYVLGQPQTMIHEFYPARELNAAFDNDQLCLNSSQLEEDHSARVLNLRKRRCFMKR